MKFILVIQFKSQKQWDNFNIEKTTLMYLAFFAYVSALMPTVASFNNFKFYSVSSDISIEMCLIFFQFYKEKYISPDEYNPN